MILMSKSDQGAGKRPRQRGRGPKVPEDQGHCHSSGQNKRVRRPEPRTIKLKKPISSGALDKLSRKFQNSRKFQIGIVPCNMFCRLTFLVTTDTPLTCIQVNKIPVSLSCNSIMILSNSKNFAQKKLKSTYYNANDLFYSSRLQFRLLLCV